MKIKDLIKQLQEGDPEADIVMTASNLETIKSTTRMDELNKLRKAFEAGMDHQCDPSTNPGIDKWLEDNY